MLVNLKNVEYLCAKNSPTIISQLQVQKGQHSLLVNSQNQGKIKETILGLLPPKKGEILVKGKNIYLLSDAERQDFCQENISEIEAENKIIPDLSLSHNLQIVRGLKTKSLSMKEISSLIELFDLTKSLEKTADKLTPQEKTSTQIVSAYLSNPELIIAQNLGDNLDEKQATYLSELSIKAADMLGATFLNISSDARLKKLFKQFIVI